jgi:hypothetical protein
VNPISQLQPYTPDMRASALPNPLSRLVGPADERRAEVEDFIATRFFEVHGARISAFMPEFLAQFDEQGRVLAVVGMRDAGCERLFLEYYLDQPIEQAIAGQTESVMEREAIVEIGNLASRDRRASRELFRSLAQYLHARHYEWAVFTGCSALHRMFAVLGIETVTLGRALQERLPRDQQTWGGYYEDNPRVVAGRIDRGHEALQLSREAA